MNWGLAGQYTVAIIVLGLLYWKAVRLTADALHIEDERNQLRMRQRTLLQVAEYLEKRESASAWDSDREWEGPFMDTQFPEDPANDSILYHQLKKSVDMTKRGPDDHAA